ncbi:MAG: dihydrofolate reductase family protein [Thermoplasmata archaeon]|nr:dihydrofolate reductase family protein [Thermoplasmata archaeon]
MADTPNVLPPRPRVLVNCAVSADGRLAYSGGRRARLSGPADLRRVQQLRAASDAILVGIGTVILDDPSLRVHWELMDAPRGKEPLRVVLDSRGRTPAAARVLDERQPTLIATNAGCARPFPPHVGGYRAGPARVDLAGLLRELSRRGVRQLLVEGGADVIASFLREGFVDQLTVFVAPVLIGGASAPPMMSGPGAENDGEAIGLRLSDVERCDQGLLVTWDPRRAPSD